MSLAAGLAMGGASSMAAVNTTTESAVTPVRFSPSVPPPGFTPTFIQFNSNAIQSLSQGGGAVGNPATDPAAFVPTSSIKAADLFASFEGTNTTFPSFHGVANPPAPFNDQYGNALIFPLRIVSTTQKFRLSNLDNVIVSNDPGNTFGSESHLAAGRDYSFTRVGIDYGPDGIKGTADDIVYNNNQPGSTPVNELLYSGVAIFNEVSDFGGNAQQNLDQSVADFLRQNPLTSISNTYTLTDDAGNNLVNITTTVAVTPEPAALGLLGGATLLLSRRRVRRP